MKTPAKGAPTLFFRCFNTFDNGSSGCPDLYRETQFANTDLMNREIAQVAIRICLPKIWDEYKLHLNQKEERDQNTDGSASSHSSDDIVAVPPYNYEFLMGYLTALID